MFHLHLKVPPPARSAMRRAAGALGLSLALGGCVSESYDGGYDAYDYAAPASAYEYGYHDHYDRRDRHWRSRYERELREHRRRDVPDSAQRVAEGRGELKHAAEHSGTVYVKDPELDKVVYRGRLERGETFTVDPKGNRVLVGDRTARDDIMKKKHEHEVFFRPDREGRPSREARSDRESRSDAGDRHGRRGGDDEAGRKGGDGDSSRGRDHGRRDGGDKGKGSGKKD